MQTPDNNKSSEAEKERFTDKKTDDRIRQHLTNEKDNISAEDIQNVQSDVNSKVAEATVTDDEKVIENKDGVEYNGKDDDDKDKPKDITPWNVID